MSDKRPWFKHYSDSQYDELFSRLIANGRVETYGFFWLLMEQVCTHGKDGKLVIQGKVLAKRLGTYFGKLSRIILELSGNVSANIPKSSLEDIEISVDNFLKYQVSWGGKRVSSGSHLNSTCPGEVEERREKKKESPVVPLGDDHPFVAIWDRERGPLPPIRRVSPQRIRAMERASAACSEDEWAKVVRWATKQNWLNGTMQPNGRQFTATIDTLLKAKNFDSYLESALGAQPKNEPRLKTSDELLRLPTFGDEL